MVCPECNSNLPDKLGRLKCPQCLSELKSSLDKGLIPVETPKLPLQRKEVEPDDTRRIGGVVHRQCLECGQWHPQSSMRYGVYRSPNKAYSYSEHTESAYSRLSGRVIEYQVTKMHAFFPTRTGWFCQCAFSDPSIIRYTRKSGEVEKLPRWENKDFLQHNPRPEERTAKRLRGFDRTIRFSATRVYRSRG